MANIETAPVEVHSGLVAETKLLLGDDIKDIRSLYLMNTEAPTLALNEKAEIIDSAIFSVPKEVYINETYQVRFSNQYTLECSAGTPVMMANRSWCLVKDLKIDDRVLGSIYTEERGIVGRVFTVEAIGKSPKALQVPSYFFLTKHGNILLPNATDDEITFICISQ